MPVRPDRAPLYGENWRDFSLYIRFERAGGRCECDGRCGDSKCRGLVEGRCTAEHGKPHPVNGKRTILTTAHLNHDETSRNEDEVAALCARCHLFYDRDHHAANRRETLAARKAALKSKILSKAAVIAFELECATGRKVAR